jgi:hypothetical protein
MALGVSERRAGRAMSNAHYNSARQRCAAPMGITASIMMTWHASSRTDAEVGQNTSRMSQPVSCGPRPTAPAESSAPSGADVTHLRNSPRPSGCIQDAS